jgi:hypothetical protein
MATSHPTTQVIAKALRAAQRSNEETAENLDRLRGVIHDLIGTLILLEAEIQSATRQREEMLDRYHDLRPYMCSVDPDPVLVPLR